MVLIRTIFGIVDDLYILVVVLLLDLLLLHLLVVILIDLEQVLLRRRHDALIPTDMAGDSALCYAAMSNHSCSWHASGLDVSAVPYVGFIDLFVQGILKQ